MSRTRVSRAVGCDVVMPVNRNVWKSSNLSESSFKIKPDKWFSNCTATSSGRETVTETVHGVAKGEACSVELGTNLCIQTTCIVERKVDVTAGSRRKLWLAQRYLAWGDSLVLRTKWWVTWADCTWRQYAYILTGNKGLSWPIWNNIPASTGRSETPSENSW
jgi:hypothetical protein